MRLRRPRVSIQALHQVASREDLLPPPLLLLLLLLFLFLLFCFLLCPLFLSSLLFLLFVFFLPFSSSSTFPSSFSSSSPSCSSSSSFLLSLPPSIRFSYMLHPYMKFWAFLLCFFLLLMLWNLLNEFSSWSCHAFWLLSFPVWRQQPVLTTLNDLFF